jgi:hypothetical protein
MSRTADIGSLHTGHDMYDKQNEEEKRRIDEQRQSNFQQNRMSDQEFSKKFDESKNKNSDSYSRQKIEIPAARAMLELGDEKRIKKGGRKRTRKTYKRRKSHKKRKSRKSRKL